MTKVNAHLVRFAIAFVTSAIGAWLLADDILLVLLVVALLNGIFRPREIYSGSCSLSLGVIFGLYVSSIVTHGVERLDAESFIAIPYLTAATLAVSLAGSFLANLFRRYEDLDSNERS